MAVVWLAWRRSLLINKKRGGPTGAWQWRNRISTRRAGRGRRCRGRVCFLFFIFSVHNAWGDRLTDPSLEPSRASRGLIMVRIWTHMSNENSINQSISCLSCGGRERRKQRKAFESEAWRWMPGEGLILYLLFRSGRAGEGHVGGITLIYPTLSEDDFSFVIAPTYLLYILRGAVH